MRNAATLVKAAALTCVTIAGPGEARAAAPVALLSDGATEIASSVERTCNTDGQCNLRITPQQLLAQAEALVQQRNYQAALPLVDALGQVPELQMQQQFLAGYIAIETGDLKGAIRKFRSILDENPGQTRVRLELARAYLLTGKEASADYHFRLAQNDENLPDEIARTIRNTRSILRDKRIWRFSFDFGFAPDSNINGATDAESIDINFGPIKLPLQLDDSARERSGIGQTAGFSGGVRVKASDRLALLFDADSKIVNYKGKASDDIVIQVAAGPELRIARYSSVSLQAVGLQRWYGGRLATREYGGRVGYQQALSEGQRVGVELDARRTESQLSNSYSGWQLGANATYEHLVGKSLIASASLFARRDLLNADGFSSVNYGVNLGLGGELPLGLNAGVSASVSRSEFDAPLLLYSTEKRQDWRGFARAYMGSRKIRFLGFSPSVDYVYSRVDSNYDLYEMSRHRVNFKFARYF
ncbi:surface lipoprotein assembly modifier [Sphingorhabdus sp. 109]|jgi:tetratricopeptide (TPR) repeat protein|uniref:surface lipoprotein assembly modifier n=1 Tax=Sphingorhabdus sp. 109 TaxID=2653173 RepID=UPI0012EF3600|nr:surface lipoprotein assembly modifier [Sphingorhabdus sp. 109]VWX59923.1 TPR repeat-containing protein [Sphingorhabdus sp. 109]